MIVSTFFFATQDALTKQLTYAIPTWQIVCFRFFFFSLFAIVYAWSTIGIRTSFCSQQPVLQTLRGIVIVCEIALFAFALRFLGLAELHTLFASAPLMVTALSVPFLKEHVGWRRWLAVAIGFIGTVIILRPGLNVFNPYALLALGSAFLMAIYILITRKLSKHDSLQASLMYFGVVGFLFSLIFLPFIWQNMSVETIKLLLLLCICGIISHALLIQALHLAPAVILQPLNYMVLVWALILAYILFGEILSTVTLLGAALVAISGLFIAYREYVVSKN